MDIKQLRLFLSVAKTESFSKTAEEQYMTQPMITKSIQKLERELGVKLIERTSKMFALTEAGRKLQLMAKEIVDRFDDIYLEMGDIKSLNTGDVTIAGPPATMATFMSKFLQMIRREYPNIRISLQESGSKNIVNLVTSKHADIGILQLPIYEDEVNVHPILSDRCVLLVNEQHPLAGAGKVSMTKLKNEQFISMSEQFALHDTLIKNCRAAGFEPDVVFKSSLVSFVVRLVALNEGISLLPLPLLDIYRVNQVVTVELEDTIPWEIALITHRKRYLSIAAQRVFELACDYFTPTAKFMPD